MDTTIRNLDEEAYRQIKSRAALEGRTLGEAVSEAIRRYVQAGAGQVTEIAEQTAEYGRITGLGAAGAGARSSGPDRVGQAAEVRESGAVYEAPRRPTVASGSRREALERLLEEEIWPQVPEELQGRGLSKREREEILGLEEGED